jgi:cobalamin biosynthesis protein CbiG
VEDLTRKNDPINALKISGVVALGTWSTYQKEKIPRSVSRGGDHVITSVIVGFTGEQNAIAFIHHFFAPSDAHDCRL